MTDVVWRQFDDFAGRWARGERPDSRVYLERAGDDAPLLLALIDDYLEWAPSPEPDPDVRAELSAWLRGEPPVVALRRRRGQRRSSVIDALMTSLGLDPDKRQRVQDAYHRLETGQLRLSRVDGRVLDVVASALGVRVTDLAAWPGEHGLEASLMMREAMIPEAPLEAWPSPAEPDEVDLLFGIS